jgi:hypothetical protein
MSERITAATGCRRESEEMAWWGRLSLMNENGSLMASAFMPVLLVELLPWPTKPW